ncbi:acyl-CoA dehydrogenase family protein [Oleiagrimonas soli]|uniref:Acyl-CoA dehydrogenase n=1 Tax=Oleiagrimonas soli TaxID=1543381 RepID=A0A099CTA0_9GAMM|nr:acyl-CoA dehydrogenase family protein [Oleiagrimonas soli]KGI77193.1 acyl-CoA dehydrogenase [Oleiagrimonas soli]MBB6185637.1 alkylation response protein AidB-like acyl-CoA dehydrogenase [Oleiagrimonas soli]
MEFLQDAPRLPHPFHQDRLLQALIERRVPAERRAALVADLTALGDYACMAYARRLDSTPGEPVLTQWGPWGERIDRIELTPAWREGPVQTTRHAVLAAGHDPEAGPHGRLEQFMRVYLYHLASEFYTCPLAMTDGAATAIKASGNERLAARALPHFLSRDADAFWLSGQWMTETAGGSDVGRTGTVARRDDDGQWRLYGRKWFTSAVVGEAALALARPEGADQGTDALALFYVETKHADGRWRELRIDRLKDKLGTRELPTAEIHLEGLPAEPVGALDHGVRLIAPMLNVTRTWNAVCATATMARCLALANDYARRRQAFGRPLIEQPLHARTLADMQAEFEAAFALTFHVAELLGQVEASAASPGQAKLLRLLTPLAKLWTGKLSVAIASETLECFGGAGYIEDTGLPQLLRDAQVYAIWEGTTNVLSLDTLRALASTGLEPLTQAIEDWLGHDDAQTEARNTVRDALARAMDFIARHDGDPTRLQAGARGLAITLARAAAAALLAASARDARTRDDARPAAALRGFLAHGIDRLVDDDLDPHALLD